MAASRMTASGKTGREEAAQAEVVAFLSEPRSYGMEAAGAATVERVETHAARIFLAGNEAYKMKRAVRYSFLDFTTLARRRAALEAELTLNRRTAPEIYLGLLPVVRRGNGLALGPPGEPVEWLLEMRRFDRDLVLDRLAEAGRLTPALLSDLADAVLALHAAAERRGPPFGGGAAMLALVEENAANLAELAPLLPKAQVARLDAAAGKAAGALVPLLDRRREEGWLRRCHGDLHLANVVLWNGRPTPFDCLEFSEEMGTIDVAYDLAFLLMDLLVRGFPDLANLVMSRYFAQAGGLEILAALPLFLSTRATIRAKVMGFRAREMQGEARARALAGAKRLLSAASGFLQPEPASLLAVGGLSGSGKSTLARALAPELGRPPGALHLSSDLLRKRLFGLSPESTLPEAAYEPEVGRRVYRRMLEEAGVALSAGQAVVLDGVFSRPEERAAAEALARSRGLRFAGLWLEAPAATLFERVRGRSRDVSDATEAVVLKQLAYDLGEMAWPRLAAEPSPEALALAARGRLQEAGVTRSR